MVGNFGIYDGPPGESHNVFYDMWAAMIDRCYGLPQINRQYHKSYVNVSICADWKYYSNFYNWAKDTYIDGYVLDKDLKNSYSKIYSPDTCVLVPRTINQSIIDKQKNLSVPLGVSPDRKKYRSRIRLFGNIKNCGSYSTPEEAHARWQLEKIDYFKELIKIYQNDVSVDVILSLQKRIDILEDDHANKRITDTFNKIQ